MTRMLTEEFGLRYAYAVSRIKPRSNLLTGKSSETEEFGTMAPRFGIQITFNGVIKPLEVEEQQSMQAVLEAAVRLFSLQSQPHTMGLFTQANVQVAGRLPSGQDIQQSVAQAGIVPSQLLVLRQVVVQGG